MSQGVFRCVCVCVFLMQISIWQHVCHPVGFHELVAGDSQLVFCVVLLGSVVPQVTDIQAQREKSQPGCACTTQSSCSLQWT